MLLMLEKMEPLLERLPAWNSRMFEESKRKSCPGQIQLSFAQSAFDMHILRRNRFWYSYPFHPLKLWHVFGPSWPCQLDLSLVPLCDLPF